MSSIDNISGGDGGGGAGDYGPYSSIHSETVKTSDCTSTTPAEYCPTIPGFSDQDAPMVDSALVDASYPPDGRGTPEPAEYIPFGGPGGDDDMNGSGLINITRISHKKKVFRRKPWLDENGKRIKRKRGGDCPDDGHGLAKMPKITPDKNASQILHEINPSLKLDYVFDDVTGPAHDPCFTVKVFYPPNNKEYVATGKSKKASKNSVAAKILEDCGINVPAEPEATLQPMYEECANNIGTVEPDPIFGGQMAQPPPPEIDFASDDILFTDVFAGAANTPPMIPNPVPFNTQEQPQFEIEKARGLVDNKVINRIKNIPNIDKNPLLAVNSLHISGDPPVYDFISEEGPPHAKIFAYKLTYVNNEFYGKGGSKKIAKSDAARKCLNYILCQAMPIKAPDGNVIPGSQDYDNETGEYNVAFSDYIHNLVTEKYDLIMKDEPEHKAQKVMAGIVMTRGPTLVSDSAKVIAVTSGTKCIEGDAMSELGLAINDCHAEILATRCLRDFFYSQLDALVKNLDKPDSIFEYSNDVNEDGVGKFKLKEDVKFHLYISTSPCGDARIISPKWYDENMDTTAPADAHPNRINRGVLRAKIEAGEGTIPVSNLNKGSQMQYTQQTWDAVLQGNALSTMSCSDKVCRWNVVGMQGALLANIIDPIYYSSIVLGSLHHPVHFRRAVVGRIEGLEQTLPDGYHVNKPHLLMTSKEEKRQVKKSPNHAVMWCTTWSCHEVLTAAKGRVKAGNIPSRVSKRQAFIRFLSVLKFDPDRHEMYRQISYADAKHLATKYQETKDAFNRQMNESGLGSWVNKPIELEQFVLN